MNFDQLVELSKSEKTDSISDSKDGDVSVKKLRTFEEVKASLDAIFTKHEGFTYQFKMS